MERRDILKDQIEQFGRALGSIIANFFQLKLKGKTAQGIEIANEQFKTQLDLDIDYILESDLETLQVYFQERKVSVQNIEELVDYIVALAESKIDIDPNHSAAIFERALALYTMATRISKIYPFSRIQKEQNIRNLLLKITADL